MLWNAKFKPEGFCAVRPTEFFGKFAPYNPGAQKSHSIPHLARLVMADPAIGVIERDIALPHIIAPV
jgi:hypothetical protein